eukprot:CAMPEP_0175419376 /NCGR_PEP_ID=MMETSP0095-20121207/46196_1 /TAXON_ID=311494 /ORGANISM="Alexandrium monilatum, Strain CCMP3105" /LENGTH=52 /DNA_ID=CAMNT_0016718563 /DNA_START=6 /DNA_END=160 /DNA_ORIENTATION=-
MAGSPSHCPHTGLKLTTALKHEANSSFFLAAAAVQRAFLSTSARSKASASTT